MAHQAVDLREHRSGTTARESETEAAVEPSATAQLDSGAQAPRRAPLRWLMAGAGAACRSIASVAGTLDGVISVVRSLVVSIAVIVGVGFGATVVINELGQRLLVIEPIQIPGSLADLGYTSENVARQLKEQIARLHAASTTFKEVPLLATSADLPEIEIPEAQTSLQQVLSYLRTYIGTGETRFAGEIIGSDAVPYTLYLRSKDGPLVIGANPKLEGDARQKMTCALRTAAEQIMEQTEPYVLAVALFASRRDPDRLRGPCATGQDAPPVEDRITQLLAKTLTSGRPADRPWVYNLRGLLLAEKGRRVEDSQQDKAVRWANVQSAIDHLDQAIGAYQAAIRADQDFALAYFNQGQAYAVQAQLHAYAAEAQLHADAKEQSAADFAKAIELYQDAVTRDPGQSYFYVEWGDTLYRFGSYEDAAKKYRKAIDKDHETKRFDDDLLFRLRIQIICAQFQIGNSNSYSENLKELTDDYPTAKILDKNPRTGKILERDPSKFVGSRGCKADALDNLQVAFF